MCEEFLLLSAPNFVSVNAVNDDDHESPPMDTNTKAKRSRTKPKNSNRNSLQEHQPPNRRPPRRRTKDPLDDFFEPSQDQSFSSDTDQITHQEKRFLVDEELMNHIMTFHGFHHLLWDNSPEEALPDPNLPKEEHDLRMEQLMTKVWQENQTSRRSRVQMSKQRLIATMGIDLNDIERQIKVRVDGRLKRMSETSEQREARLERERNLMRKKRAEETEEQRQARLEQGRNHVRMARALETPEQHEERLRKSREAVRRKREMLRMSEHAGEARRLAAERARERRRERREVETPEEAEERLARQREQTRRRRERVAKKMLEC